MIGSSANELVLSMVTLTMNGYLYRCEVVHNKDMGNVIVGQGNATLTVQGNSRYAF